MNLNQLYDLGISFQSRLNDNLVPSFYDLNEDGTELRVDCYLDSVEEFCVEESFVIYSVKEVLDYGTVITLDENNDEQEFTFFVQMNKALIDQFTA